MIVQFVLKNLSFLNQLKMNFIIIKINNNRFQYNKNKIKINKPKMK